MCEQHEALSRSGSQRVVAAGSQGVVLSGTDPDGGDVSPPLWLASLRLTAAARAKLH